MMASAEVSDCPPGWTRVKVRDVVTKIPTTGKKLKQKEYGDDGPYPVVDQGQAYIAGYSYRNDCLIEIDEPVIVFGDHTRTVKIVHESFIPGADGIKVLQPLKAVSARFLEQILYLLTIDLVDKGYARHYQHLEKASFYLPPLVEQHRIVAKIEELCSELDNGVESLKAARAQLKTYRQSLLKAAFEGRLTEQWRRDNADKLETADQLLQRIREDREARYQRQLAEWEEALAQWEAGGKCGKKPRQPKAPAEAWSLESVKSSARSDRPENWVSIRLDELVEHGRSCAYGVLQPGPHVDGGTPFVRVGDIHNGAVIQSEIKKIAPAIAEKYERTRLQGRELLISVVGAIGRTAVVPDSLAGANIARAVAMVPITQAISVHFIELYLRQEVIGQALAQQAHEVARKTLNLEDVRKIPVLLPPVEEQYETVRQLEARLSHVKHLESVVDSCLERLEVLRQSILKRAFEGKLVPQDPDDDPASELLERVRAQQEEAPKPRGRRRKANA